MPRDDGSPLWFVLFSARARHDAVQQTSSGVKEFNHTSGITATALSWIKAGAELQNDEFYERWPTRSSLLSWCPCSCMRDYSFIAGCSIITSPLIPQLSSFHLSVRVKWKSEVLHFRSFSPFKEKGRTLFAVTLLDKCAVTMVRTVTFTRSLLFQFRDAIYIKLVMSVIINANSSIGGL